MHPNPESENKFKITFFPMHNEPPPNSRSYDLGGSGFVYPLIA